MKTDPITVAIPLADLVRMVNEAEFALEFGTNDSEHNALYNLQEELREWASNLEARSDPGRDEEHEKFLGVHMRDNKHDSL